MPSPSVLAGGSTGESLDALWDLTEAMHEMLEIAPDPALIVYCALDTSVRTGSVELLVRTAAQRPRRIRGALSELIAKRAQASDGSGALDRLIQSTAAHANELAAAHNMPTTMGHIVFAICMSHHDVAAILAPDGEHPLLELEDRLLASVVDPRTMTVAAQRVLWRAVDAARFTSEGVVTFSVLLGSLIEDEGRVTAARVMIGDFVERTELLDQNLLPVTTEQPHPRVTWDPVLSARLSALAEPEHRPFLDTADVLLAMLAGPLPAGLSKTLARFGMTPSLIRSASRALVRSTLDQSDRTAVPFCDRFSDPWPDALVDAPAESATRRRKVGFAARNTASLMYHVDSTSLSIRRLNILLSLHPLVFIANLVIVASIIEAVIDRRWWTAAGLVVSIRVYNGNSPWFVWVPIQAVAVALAGLPGAVAVVCRIAVTSAIVRLSLQQRRADTVDPNFTAAQLRRDTRVSGRMTLSRARSLVGRSE